MSNAAESSVAASTLGLSVSSSSGTGNPSYMYMPDAGRLGWLVGRTMAQPLIGLVQPLEGLPALLSFGMPASIVGGHIAEPYC